MKRLLMAAIAAAVLFATKGAAAQQDSLGIHLEIGHRSFLIDSEAMLVDGGLVTVPDQTHSLLILRAGYDVVPMVTIEAETAISLRSVELTADTPAGGIPFSTKISRSFAVFGNI